MKAMLKLILCGVLTMPSGLLGPVRLMAAE
jgi:hypothetical protein